MIKREGSGIPEIKVYPPHKLSKSSIISIVSPRVYPRRWIVLATIAILNCTNTMAWIGFASVANHVNKFYGSDVSTILLEKLLC